MYQASNEFFLESIPCRTLLYVSELIRERASLKSRKAREAETVAGIGRSMFQSRACLTPAGLNLLRYHLKLNSVRLQRRFSWDSAEALLDPPKLNWPAAAARPLQGTCSLNTSVRRLD